MAHQIPEAILRTMADKFRLIGEPTRLAILHSLMNNGEKNVGQVVWETGRSEANVSRHLKLLAKAKAVARRKEGLQVFYRLTDPVIEQICTLVCGSLFSPAAESSDGKEPRNGKSRTPKPKQ